MPAHDAGVTLARDLRQTLGAQGWLDAPEALEPWLREWRGLFRGRTLGVALPASTPEVQRVVQLCRAARVPIVPQAGNTGLCGGASPAADGHSIILGVQRLRRVRELDASGGVLVAEAGCTVAELRERAEQQGRLFPLSFASDGTAQIGGALSTNAGGTNVLRYGNARELTLGLEVVLPDGRLLDALGRLRKDNTGYDLKQLFIGAEGTLGIITAAALRLYSLPVSRVTAWAGLESPAQAVQLLRRLQAATGDCVSGCELMSARALRFACRHIDGCRPPLEGDWPWHLLIEASSSREHDDLDTRLLGAFEGAIEAGLVADAAVASSLAQGEDFWRLREGCSDAQRLEGASIKHDVSVPVAAVPELIERGIAAVERALSGIRPCVFGHLGDGNLHFNLSQPRDMDGEAYLARWSEFNRIIHDIVHDLGGSISAEHGIGQLKRDELARYKSSVALSLMRDIKRSLDPDNLMNPGKVLPDLPA